jgi:ATP-dependent DNA helicase PIF1
VQSDRLPAPESLVLKVGARVMAVKNDRAKRWVNGSLGTVTRFIDDRVWVQLDRDGAEVEIDRVAWENIRFVWDDEEQRIISKMIGSYTQIPLIPAWAITIHKAQGLTLDDVQIDLGSGAFAPGQTYVALSRARSFEGLSLVRPIRPADVRVAPGLIEFGKWLQLGGRGETMVSNCAPAPRDSI